MEAQPVAAGDVRDAELLDDPGGDGALAGRRRTQDDGPEGRRGGATRGDRYHRRPAVCEAGESLGPTAATTTTVRVAAAISHRPRRTLSSIPTTTAVAAARADFDTRERR